MVFLLAMWAPHQRYTHVAGRTMSDVRKEMEHGDGSIFLAVLTGSIPRLRMGMTEGGAIDRPIDPFLGEVILKLGTAYINFPVCPPMHLAVYIGRREQLDIVTALIHEGVDMHQYEHPSPTVHGYPPAIMFALGLGQVPQNSHAAMLQRALMASPKVYNQSRIDAWLKLSGNPPLLQMTMLNGFFDGAYVLVNDFKVDVNEIDDLGVTALHIAAWNDDTFAMGFLLSKGANAFIQDSWGRTALHYAAMRGNAGAIETLLSTPQSKSSSSSSTRRRAAASDSQYRKLITTRDKFGRTALVVAALTPSLSAAIRGIRTQMTRLRITPDEMWSRAPIAYARDISFPSELGEAQGIRGGWEFRRDLFRSNSKGKSPGNWDEMRSDVDVIDSHAISQHDFIRDYFSTQRPVLLGNQLAASQRIWAHWQKGAFLDRYGSHEVHIDDGTGWPSDRVTTIHDWVTKYMSRSISANQECNTASETCSNALSQIPYAYSLSFEADGDIGRPELLDLCGSPEGPDDEPYQLYMGPRYSGTMLHTHNASWNVLLAGVKKWYFVAPGQSYNATKEARDISFVTDWITNALPLLRKRGHVVEVVQYPGDVVFVPHDWLHATLNLADSISISQQFCTFLNTDYRIQPLGRVIYGGEDKHRGIGHFNHLQYIKGGQQLQSPVVTEVNGVPQFEPPEML
jgi:JmjC domain, hydroxylase/Ankyrin repeats (3 copies)